jgi:hypothetical protein
MTIKPAVQNILKRILLKGVLHTEKDEKHNHENIF